MMNYKDFLSRTQAALGDRLDVVVPRRELEVKIRASLTEILKVGLSSSFQEQYEYHPTKYRGIEPDGL